MTLERLFARFSIEKELEFIIVFNIRHARGAALRLRCACLGHIALGHAALVGYHIILGGQQRAFCHKRAIKLLETACILNW